MEELPAPVKTLNHAERQIPKRHLKRNKPHQNTTSQFDAVYLNIFLAKKSSFCLILRVLSSRLALACIRAGRQPPVFVVSDT